MAFNQTHEKFLNSLEKTEFNVGKMLTKTAGKGATNGKSYTPPTKKTIKDTLALFDCLYAFDAEPTETTFANLQKALKQLNMKAIRTADANEWIYITPDANPGTPLWNKYSMQSQFNLSWHVGSDSKVAVSDEHNGGDGCFRVISELVRQGSNIKLIMSNSRHRATSKQNKAGRYVGDWAHSKQTIDYPIMSELARNGYSVINVHGMASRSYGLFVNNYGSNFVKDLPSLPTFIGLALALLFNDKKKFIFGGVLPGKALINGVYRPLSPPSSARSIFKTNSGQKKTNNTKRIANDIKDSQNSIFQRATGVHNTNNIGHAFNNIYNNRNNRKPGDSGKSCHIEFGIIRDGRKDLARMIAAINLAAYWVNHYNPELNPWAIVKNDPNFDMLKYVDLYEKTPEYESVLRETAANVNNAGDVSIDAPLGVTFDIDLNPNDPEFQLCEDESDDVEDSYDLKSTKLVAPILISGGPSAKAKNQNEDNTNLQATKKPSPN